VTRPKKRLEASRDARTDLHYMEWSVGGCVASAFQEGRVRGPEGGEAGLGDRQGGGEVPKMGTVGGQKSSETSFPSPPTRNCTGREPPKLKVRGATV
jgi:hypothetical protein